MTRTPSNESEYQSLDMLFQVTAADIVFFKQQQWAVMNYAIAIDAAIVAILYEIYKPPMTLEMTWLAVVVTSAIPVVAALGLKRLHNSIEARRQRLEQTRKFLGTVFDQAWRVQKELDDFYFIFIGVLVTSWLITVWLVLLRA